MERVYPSFDVDGHKEPAQEHHHDQGLKHTTRGGSEASETLRLRCVG